MSIRPRFTIKALLGVMLTVSLPLAMIAADGDWLLGGALLLVPVTGGVIGYLIREWRGVYPGSIAAMVVVIGVLILMLLLKR
jgi:hypothetical protein